MAARYKFSVTTLDGTVLTRKSQDDYYTLEGVALRDWDDEGDKPLVILEGDDWTAMKVRVDLATSLIVASDALTTSAS